MASQGSEEKKESKNSDKDDTNLLDYIGYLTANLQQVKQGFANESSDSNKPGEVYGYISTKVESYVNPSLLTGSRRQRTNMRTLHFSYITSPNGDYNYQVRNTSVYNEDTDPAIYPLRIFKIKLSDVDLSNGTFNASKATVLTHQHLKNMTQKDFTNFPTLQGKVTYDSHGNLAIQPYEQVKSGNNGYRWKANKTLLQIADAGPRWISSRQLCRGDEVQFKLMNDVNGSPFATQLHKISLIHPGTIEKNTHIQLESHKFVCNLTDTAVDTMVNHNVVEIDTYGSRMIHDTLRNNVHTSNGYINLIPTPSLFLMNQNVAVDNLGKIIEPLDRITAGDIELLMHFSSLKGRWNEIGMDTIHRLYISKFTKEALNQMERNNVLNNRHQAHWVIHHTHDTVTNATVTMVQTDYNTNAQHEYVLSTTLLTKQELKGRAGKITSQAVCEKIHTTWTDIDGYETPLLIKNWFGDTIADSMRNRSINVPLDLHMFRDDGHLSPHTIKKIGDTMDYESGLGQTKEFTILYMAQNDNVKNVLTNLSDSNMAGQKHITVQYNTIRSRTPMYGKFRQANITVISNATEEVITKLAEAGVSSIAPKVRDGYNYFKLRSKSFLQFPKQLENLQEKFRMVEIVDRNLFFVYLKPDQTFDDIPQLLGMSNPSEFKSCCLSTNEASPWTEIERNGTSVLINKIYQEDMPLQHNTVYITGFSAVMKAEWLQKKLYNSSNIEIEIVDDLDETKDNGKVTARFLQNMTYAESTIYTLALSTQNESFLASMKDKFQDINSHTKGKYSYTTTDLNRLRHSVNVISKTNEDKNDKLPGSKSLFREHREQPTGDGEFTEVSYGKNKKKTKKKKNETPEKKTNKYSILATVEEEDETSSIERSKDDGDFANNSKDTLITGYMKKHILPLVQEKDDFKKETYNKLKDNIVKLVTDSSPDYHSSTSLPTYFIEKGSRNGKLKGAGVLMKEYFSDNGRLVDFVKFTEAAKQAGNTKWQVLRQRVQTAQNVNTTNAKLAGRATRASKHIEITNSVALVTGNTAKRTRQELGDTGSSTEIGADESSNVNTDAPKKPKQGNTITNHFTTSPATANQAATTNQ